MHIFLMNEADSYPSLFIHSFDQQLYSEHLLYVFDIYQLK